MNQPPDSIPISNCSPVGLLLIIGLLCWCWLGNGFRCLRWPLLILLGILVTDNWFGGIAGGYVDAVANPILVLLIMLAGISIMFRGFRRTPRRGRCCRHDDDDFRGWR